MATSTAVGSRFDEIAAATKNRMIEELFPMLDRLHWDRETLAAHRAAALADQLAFASTSSPWHAERLRGIDLASVRPDDLSALPTMAKADLMASWNEIVTDRRLDLDGARDHLRAVDEHGPSFLLDEHLVFTTGGTTGEPGVFVWSIDEMARWGASNIRFGADAGLPPPERLAHVAARSPRHVSSMIPLLLHGSAVGEQLVIPVDQPIDAIVQALDAARPTALWVVSSMLGPLADAASSGALRIDVDRVSVGGDMLDPNAAVAAERAFGVQPTETYPTTDVGTIAVQGPNESRMTVNDDLMIVETVDADDRAVGSGELAHHLLVTSLHQRTLPLIRYRIDDSVRIIDAGGSYGAYGHIEDISGRTDESFDYGIVAVHPHLFRSAITKHDGIVDYEVRQTERGAHLLVVTGGRSAERGDALERDVRRRLVAAGLPDPEVLVDVVGHLGRSAVGKRVHFVPLART